MAVAYVQQSTPQTFADNASLVAPSLSGVTAGNHVTMLVGASQTASGAITLSAPAGWLTAEAPAPVASGAYYPTAAGFYKENSAGGTESGTVTLEAGSYAQATIIEASGLATSGSLDVHTNNPQTAGTTSGNTGTVNNTTASGIAYGIGHPEDGAGATSALSSPATAGYSVIDTSSNNGTHIACDFSYKILSAAGSQSASWTWTTNSAFIGVIIVFKGPASGPTITAQPTDQTAADAATATFTVAATGSGSLTYQWQDNRTGSFTNVSGGSGGTTASYTTAAVGQAFQGRLYQVVVTDSNGSTTSSTARLGVSGFAVYLWSTAVQSGNDIWLRDPTTVAAGGTNVAPGVGVLTITGYAPTIDQSANQAVTPGVGALTITGYAPAVVQDTAVAPGVGTLAITGYAPTVLQNTAVAPGVGSLTITGYAPAVAQSANQFVAPGAGALAITGYAPAVLQDSRVNPDVGLLTITGYAPTVDQTVGSGTNVAPDVGLLTITGYAPSVTQSANQEITPSAGQIVITGYPPDVVQSGQTAPIGGSGKVRRRYQIKIGQQVFEGSKEAVEQIARELAIEAAREEAQQPVPAIAEVVVQSKAKKPALLAATQAAADVQAAYAKALQQELMRLQDEDDEEALIALFT